MAVNIERDFGIIHEFQDAIVKGKLEHRSRLKKISGTQSENPSAIEVFRQDLGSLSSMMT
jgi:hypothetical protein